MKLKQLLVTLLLFAVCLPIDLAKAGRQESVWHPPVAPPLVVGRAFNPPQFDWLSGHRGVDLCPGVGEPVYAPTAGTVFYAGRLNDRDLVSLQLPNGMRTSFEPLAVAVTKGQFIQPGEILGTLAAGHEGNCLHWGVRAPTGEYLNPLRFLIGPPSLLPWSEPPTAPPP